MFNVGWTSHPGVTAASNKILTVCRGRILPSGYLILFKHRECILRK